MFDVEKIRADFPALTQLINEQPLVYLDSAATTQKPLAVITATEQFYARNNANVHRGRHTLSEQATHAYEQARATVADFFNIAVNELVWTKGATEAINLVANGLTEQLNSNATIVISALEHHANIVPWQQLAKRTGATLLALPLQQNGRFNIQQCVEFIQQHKPTVLAITHASNGVISPLWKRFYTQQNNKIPLPLLMVHRQLYIYNLIYSNWIAIFMFFQHIKCSAQRV
ncbi:hypothetical protein LCGC14_2623410 [marine sediment metagenome]|uniref:Aminotransferase class V domain-containing protein n=1 Tax=marine sediment metagenome TaxID=412755 RepID=A0A0F9A2F0_9ZZZZ